MKYGPITEAVYGKQDVAAFFEGAPSSRCPDCDLSQKICRSCWKAGYRGEAPCPCHEVEPCQS